MKCYVDPEALYLRLAGSSGAGHLNDRIHEKFRLHNTTEVITTVSLSLDKNQTLDFGTWVEFDGHDWRDPAAVKEITVKWDFLIKLETYKQPQRHTLTVNFSAGMSPAMVLRVVANAFEAPHDIDVSNILGGCIARVDFISHSLADELLALVGKWHSLLTKHRASGTILEKCEKNDQLIAKLIKYSIPITFCVMVYFALEQVAQLYDSNVVVTVGILRLFCLWVLGAATALWASSAIGKSLGQRVFSSITNYGAHHPFRFTRGDENLAKELGERDRKSASRFCRHIGQAILIHVLAGLVVLYLVGRH